MHLCAVHLHCTFCLFSCTFFMYFRSDKDHAIKTSDPERNTREREKGRKREREGGSRYEFMWLAKMSFPWLCGTITSWDFREIFGEIALRSKASRDYGVNSFITAIFARAKLGERVQKFDHPDVCLAWSRVTFVEIESTALRLNSPIFLWLSCRRTKIYK